MECVDVLGESRDAGLDGMSWDAAHFGGDGSSSFVKFSCLYSEGTVSGSRGKDEKQDRVQTQRITHFIVEGIR